MPGPDPRRRSPAAYPHVQTIPTRFGDMDVNGHLNNVAFAALFETARMTFNRAIDFRAAMGRRRSVVARADIHYLAEGSYPEDVEIGTGIGEVGGRSWQVLAAMFQQGRCIATCDVVAVMVKGDGDGDGDGGLPDAFRERLAGWRLKTV